MFRPQDRFANEAAGANSAVHRNLVAFDFDHTVVDDNTDIVVRDLVKSKISDEITKLYKKSGWTQYMQEIFYLLHADGFTKAQIQRAIEGIPEVSGFVSLLKRLHDTGTVDTIVISDSNSEFIKFWCDYNGVSRYINRIFTNQAHFTSDDVLKIKPYHHQLECKLSSENLCKGSVLEDYVRAQYDEHRIVYDRVFYVGDGHNDICPVLRLSTSDFGMARKGYSMHKELENQKDNADLKATVKVWADGHELNELIFQEI